MEQSRKTLKIMSIVILVLAAITLFSTAFELLFGDTFTNVEIPEGSPENIVPITKIFLAVITVIMLIPRVYLGVKGIKVANSPNSSKGHIVWGVILLVLSVFSIASPVSNIINSGVAVSEIISIAGTVLDIVIFAIYVKAATVVRN